MVPGLQWQRVFDPTDKVCPFGGPGWSPVVGDWNGDSRTEVGVYQNGMWILDFNSDWAFGTGDRQMELIYSIITQIFFIVKQFHTALGIMFFLHCINASVCMSLNL